MTILRVVAAPIPAMRSALLALLLWLPPAQAQVYPGWAVVPLAPDGQASELALKCVDGECAADTLQCVYFRRAPERMPETMRTDDLLGGKFTWGQFEFWLARRYLDERKDQPVSLETINESRRLDPPSMKTSGTIPYVAVTYATKVGGAEARLPVALWVKGREIRGLRCSYRVVDGDDPAAKIAQLLDLVVAQ